MAGGCVGPPVKANGIDAVPSGEHLIVVHTSKGTITRYITEPFASNQATKVPTTIAEFGNSLYAVTAGFAPPAPDFVVRLLK
jgi:hypothetical protein